jgi:hypothetical protein
MEVMKSNKYNTHNLGTVVILFIDVLTKYAADEKQQIYYTKP